MSDQGQMCSMYIVGLVRRGRPHRVQGLASADEIDQQTGGAVVVRCDRLAFESILPMTVRELLRQPLR